MLTAEQEMLRQALREVLDATCSSAAVRAAWAPDWLVLDDHVWRQLADLGLLGLMLSEELGGMGGDEADLAVLMEECGRFAVPGPLAEHLAVGVPVLAEAGSELAGPAAAGEVLVTSGPPGSRRMPSAAEAGAAVFLDGSVAFARAGEFRALDRVATVDQSIHSFEVEVLTVTQIDTMSVDVLADRAALAVSAQLLGLAARMIELSVDYAKIRIQFDTAIGTRQAVKHELANAHTAVEHARPVVHHAARMMANHDPDRARDVSTAKVVAARAAHRAARVALQCHGAIGYAWEHDLHLWMKRVWSLEAAWGTVADHCDRVADLVIGPEEDIRTASLW